MNKKELLEEILKEQELSHLTKKEGESLLNHIIASIKETVSKGDDVSLIGLGTFTKTVRAARTGINPATGEKIEIKAKTVPKFKAGKGFKDFL